MLRYQCHSSCWSHNFRNLLQKSQAAKDTEDSQKWSLFKGKNEAVGLRWFQLLQKPWQPPHSRAPKKNTSHGNEVLLQDTIHLIQRPYYQRESLCLDPAGNWTTWRYPDDRKETQTAVVWSCLPFIRSGQNYLANAQWKGEEDKADKGRRGKTTSGNGQAWSSASPRGQWRTGKNGENWLQNHLWCPNDPRG